MQLGALACSLSGLAPRALDMIFHHVRPATPHCGRPWALPLEQRVIIACTHLRTNLTVRELAAVFGISPSQAHRIVTDLIPRIAALLRATQPTVDRRHGWGVDGTLVPTRDHSAAAKAKNYRWSCNAQVLVRRRDLRVITVAAGGPGNRNDPIHYRGSDVERLCRVHGRVLADGGYRGVPELVVPAFRGRRWFETVGGAVIDDDAHASNTPLLGSRTGASCAITGGAAHTYFNHCKRLLCSTTSGSKYETALSRQFRTAADTRSRPSASRHHRRRGAA